MSRYSITIRDRETGPTGRVPPRHLCLLCCSPRHSLGLQQQCPRKSRSCRHAMLNARLRRAFALALFPVPAASLCPRCAAVLRALARDSSRSCGGRGDDRKVSPREHVLAAGTPRLRVLCSVMRVVLVSTLLREPTTAVCVLLVASMAIWTHLQRVWSAMLVGTLLQG